MMKIGTTMTLELYKQNQKKPEKYTCSLQDQSKGFIYIDYPIKTTTRKTSFFFEGTQFQVSFIGHDGSVYWFESEVVARKKLQIPVLVLTFPGMNQLVRIQRRKYVRVETSIDVSVRDLQRDHVLFTAVTQDISGGGAALHLPRTHHLIENQEVQLTIVLPMNSGDYVYIEVKGIIIRVLNKEASKEQASIEFKDLTDKHRQMIIKYCFEQQMERRQRELM